MTTSNEREWVRCPACEAEVTTEEETCRACGELLGVWTPLEVPAEDTTPPVPFRDEAIGAWSEVKHTIVEKYAAAYTTIMETKRHDIRRVVYADGFAGSGAARRRHTDEQVPGSAQRVLAIPGFDEYHFVELNPDRAERLADRVSHSDNVTVWQGDCNYVLRTEVLPRCRYRDRARGLFLLDPYGLTVEWELLKDIGAMKSVEIFFNFMIVSANRNVLWSQPERVNPRRQALLTRAWGDESWKDIAYKRAPMLFGETLEKVGNEEIVEAYRKRLQTVAGFEFVPQPIPMRNDRGATIYYLFFAGPNKTGARIAAQIFSKYRR